MPTFVPYSVPVPQHQQMFNNGPPQQNFGAGVQNQNHIQNQIPMYHRDVNRDNFNVNQLVPNNNNVNHNNNNVNSGNNSVNDNNVNNININRPPVQTPPQDSQQIIRSAKPVHIDFPDDMSDVSDYTSFYQPPAQTNQFATTVYPLASIHKNKQPLTFNTSTIIHE